MLRELADPNPEFLPSAQTTCPILCGLTACWQLVGWPKTGRPKLGRWPAPHGPGPRWPCFTPGATITKSGPTSAKTSLGAAEVSESSGYATRGCWASSDFTPTFPSLALKPCLGGWFPARPGRPGPEASQPWPGRGNMAPKFQPLCFDNQPPDDESEHV
jgi:hypothetical protein